MKIVSADITGSFILNNVNVTTTVESSSIWSGSIAQRVTDLESWSSSLDTTYATDASVTASILVLSQSVQASEFALSSSFASTSGSLSTRVTNVESTSSVLTSASASFAAQSASLSTRVTNNEATGSVLTSASASFAQASGSQSTRTTNLESTASVLTTASASFAVVSGSYASASGSLSTRVTNLESTSSTVSSSFASTSGSIAGRVTCIEGQYATTGSNTFTRAQRITDVSNAIGFASTASLYTDGGLRVTRDSFVSGTAYFNNVVVYGTSSIQYITSSQLNIGTNIINLNTDTPAVRFGGIAVADSGSNFGITGSLLWDSQNNRWIYSNPSGSTYDGGMLISGPRNTTGLGNEVGTTACAVMIGQGGDHITSSGIFSYANATCFYGTSLISGSGNACFSGQVCASSIVSAGTIQSTTDYASTVACSPIVCAGTSCATSFIGGTFSGTTSYASTVACSPVGCFTTSCASAFIGGTVSGTTGTFSSNVVATGSLIVAPSSNVEFQVQSTGVTVGNVLTDVHNVTGSLRITGSILGIGNSCFCSVCSPSYTGGTFSGTTIAGTTLYGSTAVCAPTICGGNVCGTTGCFGTTCSPSYLGGTFSGTTLYGSTVICGASMCTTGNTCFGGMTIVANCLGIGTATPGYKLEVIYNQNSAGTIGTRNSSAGTAAVAGLQIGNDQNPNAGGIGVFSSGYTPANAYPVNGTYVYSNRSGGIAIISECATAPLYLGTCNLERMRITSAGCVGINASSPCRLLDVRGTVNLSTTAPGVASTAGAYADIHLRTYGPTPSSPARITVVDNWMDFVTTYTDGFRWYNYTSDGVTAERMRLTTGGNLTIGDRTPEGRLHLFGCVNGYGANLVLTNWCNATGVSTGIDFGVDESTAGCGAGNAQIKVCNIGAGLGGNAADMIFSTWNGAAFGERFRISCNGVSVFSSTVCAPSVVSSGTINWNGTVGALSYSTGLVTMETNSATCIQLKTNGSTAITISPSQNVGIGTVTPGYKLDVNGTSYFNGTMGINGEGNGLTIDTGYGNNGRVGLMKYGGLEGMLVAGNTTVLRLGHRTDSDYVATSGTPTIREDLRITTTGVACFSGLVCTQSGVRFGNGSSTLNYYEEGSWTPSIGGTGGNGSATYQYRSGTYVRVGNYVFVRWGFLLGSFSGASGTVRINGLPFTANNWGSYQEPNVSVSTGNLTTCENAWRARMYVEGGGTSLQGRIATNADTAWDTNDFSGNEWIIGEIFYNI